MNQRWDPSKWSTDRVYMSWQPRTVHRCLKTINVEGITIQCERQFRDDFKGKIDHTCTFETILKFVEQRSKMNILNQMFLAHIMRCNISFSAAASTVSFDFFQELIREGQRSILKLLPESQKPKNIPLANKIFINQSWQTIARNTEAMAMKVQGEIWKNLQKFKYACLQIDGGKINGIPILDITVNNAFSEMHPLLYRAIRHFEGNKDACILAVSSAITELSTHGVEITSIVGDNCPTQKEALNHSPVSLQELNFLAFAIHWHLLYKIALKVFLNYKILPKLQKNWQ